MPYDAIKYLTAECNYGGRVTDTYDRRALRSILEKFYSPAVVETTKFNFDEGIGIYYIPNEERHQSFINYIQNLPLNQNPNLFGMHQNASVVKDLNETHRLFDSLLIIKGGQKDSVHKNEIDKAYSIDQIVSSLADKLPEIFDEEFLAKKFPTDDSECMNVVLIQEIQRFNKLLIIIKSSLEDILKGLKGTIVISDELEEMIDSIMKGKVPIKWKAKSYPSLKSLGSYINDLIERLAFFKVKA